MTLSKPASGVVAARPPVRTTQKRLRGAGHVKDVDHAEHAAQEPKPRHSFTARPKAEIVKSRQGGDPWPGRCRKKRSTPNNQFRVHIGWPPEGLVAAPNGDSVRESQTVT
jgi:hypothetical protein